MTDHSSDGRCCCNYVSGANETLDKICGRSLVLGFANDLHPQWVVTGDLEYEVFSITSSVRSTAGSGSIRMYRFPHPQGSLDNRENAIEGAITPNTNVVQLFYCGWCVQGDGEKIQAFECDEFGEPMGEAWYEQDLTEFWDSTYAGLLEFGGFVSSLKVAVGCYRKDGKYYRYIRLNDSINVAVKEVPEDPLPGWVGFRFPEVGGIVTAQRVGGFGRLGYSCNALYTNDYIDACDQLPLVLGADLTGFNPILLSDMGISNDDAYVHFVALFGYRFTSVREVGGGDPRIVVEGYLFPGPVTGTFPSLSRVSYFFGSQGFGYRNVSHYYEWIPTCDETAGATLNLYQTVNTGFGYPSYEGPGVWQFDTVGLTTPASPP